MRERIGRVAVMRLAAHERDRARDPVAFAAADDGLARRRGAQIIDPQVERRMRAERVRASATRAMLVAMSISVRIGPEASTPVPGSPISGAS